MNEEEDGNSTMMTLMEEDGTLASVMQRLAENGWKVLPDGVLWWTLDDTATALTLAKCNEAAIELNAIVTFDPEKRKRGSGGKTLRDLLTVLDGLSIGCYVHPVPPRKWVGFRPRPENGLGKRSLKAWYKRHGFKPVSMEHGLTPDMMYRPPDGQHLVRNGD